MVNDEKEFEVEDIIAHRLVCPNTQAEYSVLFCGNSTFGSHKGLSLCLNQEGRNVGPLTTNTKDLACPRLGPFFSPFSS